MRHIPNFITSLNLASGFIAIVLILNGHPVPASWVILLAMVFDFFDGFASRLLKAYSDMGKELDSLADMVSFGVAPGLLVYTVLSANTGFDLSVSGILMMAVSAFFPVCAGLRLAKFNIDTTQTTSFRGLPTPAAALSVVSLILSNAYSDAGFIKPFISSAAAVAVFSFVISLLMVTRIPLLSLKFHDLKFKGNEGRFLLIAVAVLLVAVLGFSGIPFVIPAYIAVSLLSILL
jgi:CDP-diacylglycerol---serine O-phosphatidyltransferase